MLENYDEDLTTEVGKNPKGSSPSIIFFKDLWKIRVREKSKQFFVMYIIGVVLSVVLISIDMTSVNTIDENKNPSYDYDDPFLYFYIQVLSEKYTLSMGPQNSFVQNLSDFFYNYGKISFDIKDSIKSIKNYLNSDIEQGLAAYFQHSEISNYDFTILNKQSSQFAKLEFYNSIFRYIFNLTTATKSDDAKNIDSPISLNLSSRFYPHPKMKPQFGYESVTSFYVILAFYYISIVSATLMFKLNSEKVLFYLKINGFTDIKMFTTFISCSLLEYLPVAIIVSIAVTFISKSLRGSNFFIVLVSTILFVLGRTFFVFASSTFFMKFNNFGIHFIFILLFPIAFMLLSMFRLKLPYKLFMALSAFSPSQAYMMSFSLMTKCKEEVGALSFSLMNEKIIGFSMSEILGLQICNTFIMFLLMSLFILNMSRLYGHAILGWKNMFKKNYWKRLFRKTNNSIRVSSEIQSIMKIENLEKTYKGHVETKALNGLNCDIKNEETIVMIGPNGSGKSTLIDCIIGTIGFDSGSIQFFDEDLNEDFSLIYDNLGIVFQSNVLINELTVKEHFELIGALHSIQKERIESETNYFLSLLSMPECIDNRAESLSGGQKRKLCIALALLSRPPLIIFDEPTAGVDVQSREVIWKALTLFKDVTSLITTHALEEAESVCSRLFIMVKGQIAFMGTPAELRKDSDCGYIFTIVEEYHNENAEAAVSVTDNLLNFVQERIPEAKKLEEKEKSIIFPADLRVADLLEDIENMKESLGIQKYTIHIQNLEESLVKLIENEEVDQMKM